MDHDPFLDERLRVANLPVEPQKVSVTNAVSGAEKEVAITLFRKAGEVAGTRRGISEIVKWVNYVTGNRFVTVAADLSESINLEHGSIWGHYDPETNPLGTRLKAAIQEAGNVSTAIGLVSQSASLDPEKFAGVWAISGTYGAFTPLMYTPARVWSQQNQDSPFRMGVLHILVGHSGPETAADGRTHFGIFAPQVWKLFPRGQTIHLNFWDYNDVAPAISRQRRSRHERRRSGSSRSRSRDRISRLQIARTFADKDLLAAAKGFYVIRDSSREAAPRLRHRAGVQFDGQSCERAAQARGGWRECARHRRDQRGVVRPAAGGVSQRSAAARRRSTI